MQPALFPIQLSKEQEREYNELSKELEKRFERHDHILKHGAGDPFWHDGTNLMLIRGHIIYHKRKLYEIHCETTVPLPPIALKPTPPEYPLNHCVKCWPNHS